MKNRNPIVLITSFLLIFAPSLLLGKTDNSKLPDDKNSSIQINQAGETEEKHLEALKKELGLIKASIEEEFHQQEIYKIQINSLKSFLIIPQISISTLVKGLEEIGISTSLIKLKAQQHIEKETLFRQKFSATKEKILIIDQRISDHRSASKKDRKLDFDIKELLSFRSILDKQQIVLQELLDLITSEINIYKTLQDSFAEIKTLLKKEIKEKKGSLLFQKDEIGLFSFWEINPKNELAASVKNLGKAVKPDRLKSKFFVLKDQINIKDLISVMLYILFVFFVLKGLSFLKETNKYIRLKGSSNLYPLAIFEKNLFIILLILFTVILSKTSIYILFPDLITFFKSFLTIVLLTKIVSDTVHLISAASKLAILKILLRWESLFVWGVNIYSFLYLFLYRFVSIENMLLIPLRILSEGGLAISLLLFWREFKKDLSYNGKNGEAYLIGMSMLVVFLGLFADISGYGYLASWWFLSWGESIVVVCILYLFILSLKGVTKNYKKRMEPGSKRAFRISYPAFWIFSNSIYLILICTAIIGMSYSWGVNEYFFGWLSQIFYKQFSLGKIDLSLSKFAYSFFLIFLTYVFTQILNKILFNFVLKGSGLSTGAKESIVTICKYAAWSTGILFSLSVLGLNSTSLAVVFGAIGIGLGFGLQNIFNNFISGLILLFERPIQVGDAVEVGGTWGEVKKINVRSTLIQTYTNSSLIIPNSEFISAKVTNWSHKDQYIRRDLPIGVAYGSDTGLVKKILLQAADSVEGVYDYPERPKIQFINFGDSSLDFRVRFWSDIDNFIQAESDLRFEIDRLFRQNNVVIPFPQRDVHIKKDSEKEPEE